MEGQSPMSYLPPVQSHSFVERVIGALKLERPIFDEVRRDPSSMMQAAAVMAVGGFASGIGAYFVNRDQTFTIDDRTYNVGGSLIAGIAAGALNILFSLIVWVLIALIYRFVAIRLLGSQEVGIQWQEVARPIGFAAAPSVLSLFNPIPLLGPLAAGIGSIWAFAAQIVALSETFHVSKWRAFGIIVVSALAVVAVVTVLGCICVLALIAVT